MNRAVSLTPVAGRWLLYAPLHEVGAVINDAAAARIRAGDLEALPGSLRDEIVRAPAAAPAPLDGEYCPSFLGIIPTRSCNIDCGYCNFGGPTAETIHMKPEVAVAAVDWMAERLVKCGREELRIHFFGGEPFVSPEIVDIVVHRARAVCAQRGLRPYIDASTNGVFSESRCQWVGDYLDGVVLSLDGPAEFQDRNRPGRQGRPTFEIVDRTARRLARMPIELCLRVCVTQDSVAHLERITRWMIDAFDPSVVNFETLTPGPLAAAAGLSPPDPYEFAIHGAEAFRLAEELGVRGVYSASEVGEPRLSFCPVGTDAMIVAVDGRASACYLQPQEWTARGMDLDVGWVHAGGEVEIDLEAAGRPHAREVVERASAARVRAWDLATATQHADERLIDSFALSLDVCGMDEELATVLRESVECRAPDLGLRRGLPAVGRDPPAAIDRATAQVDDEALAADALRERDHPLHGEHSVAKEPARDDELARTRLEPALGIRLADTPADLQLTGPLGQGFLRGLLIVWPEHDDVGIR